ncbi:plasmid pRiA4b ORF-3 family protein, partial [Clostridioides difficile]|nr:plasmid pRiA4b ORF-3 family protein [Clostridioides difficile]
MPTPAVAVLKVTLDDIEPTIMRRVVVPANIALDRL